MTRHIRAHFDGKVIVPDEPVELPVNQPLRVDLRPDETAPSRHEPRKVQERLDRLALASGIFSGPQLHSEALRRENLYD